MRLIILPLVFLFVAGTASAETLLGEVVGITDGDTLTLLVNRTQHKIRLGEIDTPERGQDWGTRATQALSEKVFREEVRGVVTDVDRYDRLIGKIWLDDRDINREMVREGHAWVYRRYLDDQSLITDEAAAKSEGIGLWSIANPVPPWDWRRGARSPHRASQPSTIQSFTCGVKRYCREMISCEEAKFHLSQCGLSRLDGDSDGVPCEAICR